MQKLIQHLNTGREIISFRLRNHGLSLTFLWLYVRGVDFIRGIPFQRYCQITPVLFVGPQFRKSGKRELERWGITASVNMRTEYDDALHELTFDQYCHLPTVDDQAPTLDQLDRGVEFIGKAISDGGKVYIHCAGGIGRAPTMAAAYFIHQGMVLEEAIALIRMSRPIIRIMPPQLEQLKRYEVLQRETIDESQEISFRDRETTREG